MTLRLVIAASFLLLSSLSLFAQSPADKPEDCACEQPVPALLATVGSAQILNKDLSPETANAINALKDQVIDARKRELDLQINSKLLDLTAKKQGISTKKLLENEVIAKAKEPTQAEARDLFAKNSGQLSGTFETHEKQIIDYLRQQNQEQAARAFADRLRAANDVRKLVETAPPPSFAADRYKVLATVNGAPIKSSDIEDSLKPLIYSVQRSIYQRRKDEIDTKINDLLLEAEAKKQGVTTKVLLDREVDAKLPAVTEAEAQKFFDENKARINGEFDRLKPQIISYLTEENKNKLTQAFADRLRSGATIKYFITQPEAPVYNIAVVDQPFKGAANAPVTVVEFVDFQCPRCAVMHGDMLKLVDEFKGKVRLVLIDYPLSQHEFAGKAAEAAEAARVQGKYWEYTDLLYKNQSTLDVAKLKEYATNAQLDRSRFDAELDSGKYAEKVESDADLGGRIGVGATPTIFVNGRQVDDVTYAGVRAAISVALGIR